MEAKLKIKEAIEFFNTGRAEGTTVMTAASLALVVFKDTKAKPICKIKLFSGIVNNRRRFVDLKWLIRISEITGYPVELLIEYS